MGSGLWVAILVFYVCFIFGFLLLERYLVLSFLCFTFAGLTPLTFVAGQSYVEGKREEARGRIEAARARKERR